MAIFVTKLIIENLVDVVKEFLSALFCLAACNEVWRQFLPLFREFAEVMFDVSGKLPLRELIGFREDDAEWDAVFAEPFDEFQVDALRFVACIDEQKEVHHLFATQDVACYHPLQFVPLLLPPLGITIAGEVDEMPLFINKEVVDEDGLPWCGRRLGEACSARQHVDEARLANVASPYKSEFRQISLRTLVHTGAADKVFG